MVSDADDAVVSDADDAVVSDADDAVVSDPDDAVAAEAERAPSGRAGGSDGPSPDQTSTPAGGNGRRRKAPRRGAPGSLGGDSGEESDAVRDDHLGIFDTDVDDGPATGEVDLTELREALSRNGHGTVHRAPAATRTAVRRDQRVRERRRRRRRVRSTVIAVLVLVLIAAGAVLGVVIWRNNTRPPTDFAGVGDKVVVVRVYSGDGLVEVGQTLADAGVVANAQTFVDVASADADLKALQPGYYKVHMHSSAQAVTDELADPANRVGQLRIIPGQTLADLTTVSTSGSKSTRPGILSTIAAECVPTNGEKACFSMDELWQVAETVDPEKLGVVGWAVDAVKAAPDPRKRLEGVILPGDYDIAPGSTALQALTAVVSASASQWNTTHIVAGAKAHDITPYQEAVIASLVQAEGLTPDMPKVARVVYNRLDQGMKMQMDSTVNYALDRAQIATSSDDRANPSPYNTYAHEGLPPTPIASPGPAALDAAADPADGSWLYFVKVDLQGDSCFSTTDQEHQACVDKARANGVFG
jgi:UPF0755 protein